MSELSDRSKTSVLFAESSAPSALPACHVRPATVADAYAIAKVHVQSWRDSCRNILPEQVRFLVDQSVERCFEMHAKGIAEHDISGVVAEADGRVVGFAVAGPSDRAAFASELFALYVLPEAQGHGVGRALVGRLAASLRADGHDSLLAWVLVDNPATRFYERLGAEACATDTLTLGGEALEEVGFGWHDLAALARFGAASVAQNNAVQNR
ncbi:MAG: GNAT family N-acetyltransferase [Trueperaceae bacterium]|nr:GNAT family N-acetyltransferase [Trueperaceae bacterium]